MRRLTQEWAELNAKYPLLQPPIFKNDRFAIEGILPILDRNGTLWDNFDIRIDIEQDYPVSMPVITEIGRKIPRDGNWHINRDDTCCVSTTAEQFRKLHQKITVLNWVEMFAVPFFANYIYRKETGAYYNGEWSHGAKGIYEDYAQHYGITDINLLLKRLQYCSDRQIMSSNELCFCNSGKKYKRCYLMHPESHRHFIPKKVIWRDILLLNKLK